MVSADPGVRGPLDAGERQYQLTRSTEVVKLRTDHNRQIAPLNRQLAGLKAKAL